MMNTNENGLFVFPVLRTCAHCGGDARYEYPRGVTHEIGVWVECDDCGACSDVHYHDDEGVAVLYAAQGWNRRVERASAPSPMFPNGWHVFRDSRDAIILVNSTGDAYTFTRSGDPLLSFLWQFLSNVVDLKQTKTLYPAL